VDAIGLKAKSGKKKSKPSKNANLRMPMTISVPNRKRRKLVRMTMKKSRRDVVDADVVVEVADVVVRTEKFSMAKSPKSGIRADPTLLMRMSAVA